MVQAPHVRRWVRRVCVVGCLLSVSSYAAIWWSSQLSKRERHLIGRWQGTHLSDGKRAIAVWEFRPDRTCRVEVAITTQANSVPSEPTRVSVRNAWWRVSEGELTLQDSLPIGTRIQNIFDSLITGRGWPRSSHGDIQELDQDSIRLGVWTMHRQADQVLQ